MLAAALGGASRGPGSRAGDSLLPRDGRETDSLFRDLISAEPRSQGAASKEKWYLLSNEQNGAEPSATPLRTPQPPVVAGHPWALQARHLSPSIR